MVVVFLFVMWMIWDDFGRNTESSGAIKLIQLYNILGVVNLFRESRPYLNMAHSYFISYLQWDEKQFTQSCCMLVTAPLQ